MEVLGPLELLRREPRADDRAVDLDQRAVGPVRERDLRDAGDGERVREPEHEREREHGDDGAAELPDHLREHLHERAERERREDRQAGDDDDHAGEQHDERRACRCGTCPAEGGADARPASEPATASAAISGTKRPR